MELNLAWIIIGILFALLVFYTIYLRFFKKSDSQSGRFVKWVKVIRYGFATLMFALAFYVFSNQLDFSGSWEGHQIRIILSGFCTIYGLILTITSLLRPPESFVKDKK